MAKIVPPLQASLFMKGSGTRQEHPGVPRTDRSTLNLRFILAVPDSWQPAVYQKLSDPWASQKLKHLESPTQLYTEALVSPGRPGNKLYLSCDPSCHKYHTWQKARCTVGDSLQSPCNFSKAITSATSFQAPSRTLTTDLKKKKKACIWDLECRLGWHWQWYNGWLQTSLRLSWAL